MKSGPSDLHIKVLDNLNAEARKIEGEIEVLSIHHKVKKKPNGFIGKIMAFFKRN